MKRALFFVMLFGLLAAPTAVLAQEYPIQGNAQVLSFGAQRPGQTFNKNDCGFQAGAQASIRVNDTAAGNKAVASDGCVKLAVRIVDEDTISIDGREFPALRCRANTIFVTAPVPGGAAQSRQVQNRFTIACGAAAAGGTLPRTGADIGGLGAAGAALTVVGSVVVLIVRRRRSTDLSTV